MTTEERYIRMATANADTLAQVDCVLEGRGHVDVSGEPNIKSVTLKEAARRLGVSRPTIYRMKKAGALKAYRLNGVDRILLSSLLERATAKA